MSHLRPLLPRDPAQAQWASDNAASKTRRVMQPRTARCDNCRLKKIKCDNKLPRCTRCVMSDLPCQPFKKEIQIVFSQSSTPNRQTALQPVRRARVVPAGMRTGGGLAKVVVNPFNAATIHRLTLFNKYCDTLLPRDPSIVPEDTRFLLATLSSDKTDRMSVAVRVAVTASFCICMGDRSLQRYSLEAYGRAVMEMKTLAMTFGQQWHRLLEASLLLYLYEETLEERWGRPGFNSHSVGIKAVLKMLGPAAFQVEPYHGMFLCARIILLQKGAKEMRPSFVLDPDWATVPFAKHPMTSYQKAMEIKGRLAVPKSMAMRECQPEDIDPSGTFCTSCRKTRRMFDEINDQLDILLLQLEAEQPHLKGVSHAKDGGRTALGPVPFHNLVEHLAMTQYWYSRLQLHAHIWELKEKPAKACHAGVMEDLARRDDAYMACGRAVLRNSRYMMSSAVGAWMRMNFVASIRAAAVYYQRRGGPEELKDKSDAALQAARAQMLKNSLTTELESAQDGKYFV